MTKKTADRIMIVILIINLLNLWRVLNPPEPKPKPVTNWQWSDDWRDVGPPPEMNNDRYGPRGSDE